MLTDAIDGDEEEKLPTTANAVCLAPGIRLAIRSLSIGCNHSPLGRSMKESSAYYATAQADFDQTRQVNPTVRHMFAAASIPAEPAPAEPIPLVVDEIAELYARHYVHLVRLAVALIDHRESAHLGRAGPRPPIPG